MITSCTSFGVLTQNYGVGQFQDDGLDLNIFTFLPLTIMLTQLLIIQERGCVGPVMGQHLPTGLFDE
jgi:hypothetical protein